MQFYWHYKNGRIRVFQRQTAAFSPILSRQLSKFDVGGAVAPGTLIVTDDWSGYAGLRKHGYDLTTPLLNVGIPKWQRSSCPSSISSSPISRRG